MIIKEIKIKNFRSYYGDKNVFKFSDGLTLILGENGDGKTTFFEALQWLFNTTIDKGNIESVSEMRKSKLEVGEHDEVSVYMSFEHDGIKSVEKSFTFERTGENTYKVGPLIFRGFETNGSERVQVNGKYLIDRCYDAFIQRFSMFKGESELNVFNDKTALKQLVDKFSDIRKFDELVEYTKSFEEKSNAAYLKEMRSDDKVSRDAKSLESRIMSVSQKIGDNKRDIRDIETSIEVFSTRLEELEANQETSERYKEIEARRKTQEDKKNKFKALISAVDYNHSLLDRQWILCAFPDILKEFKDKCSALSKEKRKQEKEFDKKQAEELGKLKAVEDLHSTLVNGTAGLPWYLPNQETMEEMLSDRICKVCGRPVEEGSDAYKFMVAKLEDYKRHVEMKLKNETATKQIEEQVLFPHSNIEDLHNLSISLSGSNQSFVAGIAQEIVDRRELVDRYRSELKAVEEKLQDIQDEKARLLIQAGNVSETVLEKDFNDIRGLFQQKGKAEVRLAELKSELAAREATLKNLQSELDALDPNSSQVRVMRDVHRVLNEIAKAFGNAKEENLRRFLSEMEDKANEYLETLSATDFHGRIRLVQTANESTEIKLYSSNGTEISKPSGSQKTVMYISILFAISDFTQEKRDEDYPLIFDAATSSFGDVKEDYFYNVINSIRKQCIIVTKDFITKGEVRLGDVEKLNCPVYRIKKAVGFDPNNLATIRTTVNKIKE